jgi:hypothetical protein
MSPEVIKSFLVGLGFGVDEASLAKFNKAIASATLKVTALYGSIKIAAAGIAYGISKISEDFERMGYEYHIIAPAINKALLLRRELLKAYSAAGINISQVVRESLKLNLSLTKTKFAFEAIYKSVAAKFFPLLTKQSDIFRAKLYANLPKIQKFLDTFVKGIFKAFEATVELGTRLFSILTRVYDFFVALDKATDGWSTIIVGLISAWKLLNLEFLATPLGMLLAGFLAILALYDDFKTFEEGGKSLFNWAPFIPVINAVKDTLVSLWKVLQAISDAIGNVVLSVYQLAHGDFRGAWDSLGDSGRAILSIFGKLWDVIKGIGNSLLALGNWSSAIGLFGGNGNVAANLGTGAAAGPPLGVGPQTNTSQTNAHLQQQTNINVYGAPDANSTARAVSSEQNKTNFDLVRNLSGAVKPGGILGQ